MKNLLIASLLILLISNCASHKIKDIQYNPQNQSDNVKSSLLNVFTPRKESKKKRPVVIFIHGGYWEEGHKDIYGFLGRNFAKQDIVTVIPNYTLSPNNNYDGMAKDVVKALQWTQKHIAEYGGDAEQIYLMGHSAGGHLITLIATNPKYLENTDAIKGIILNDAAGLDMKSYLEKNPPTAVHNYETTWTTNPKTWKDASPIYFLNENTSPFLIYVGEKTYESIKVQNAAFVNALNQFQPNVKPIYLNKKHVPMMSQFFFPWSSRYDEILQFIEN